MALFSRTKQAEATTPKKAAPVTTSVKQALATDRDLTKVIKGPRITEKSVRMGDANVYTFTITRTATKFLVRDAVKALYGVTPVKVNIVSKRPAQRLKGSQNRMVQESGYKKAYVYLKKGDTINLV